jgi:hypothetical protein
MEMRNFLLLYVTKNPYGIKGHLKNTKMKHTVLENKTQPSVSNKGERG